MGVSYLSKQNSTTLKPVAVPGATEPLVENEPVHIKTEAKNTMGPTVTESTVDDGNPYTKDVKSTPG